jgi:hypothetical protein
MQPKRIPDNPRFQVHRHQVSSSTNLSPNLFVLEYINQNTIMASSGGPEAEFDDPHRKELIEALKDALFIDTIRPTAWACLWLSDIDKLKDLVAAAQATPILVQSALEGVEVFARIVPTCKLLSFTLFDC